MEILLLSDIAGIGKKNDLLVVGNGYALNHLLPNRKAIVVTPSVRKRYADAIKKRALERETEKSAQQSSLQTLAGKHLTFITKATPTGKLYAAITHAMIIDQLKNQFGIGLSEDQVNIKDPIKSLGTHTVGLQIGDQVTPLQVEVKASKASKKA